MAMAIPPRLMTLALMPNNCISKILANIASGRLITATSAERACSKKTRHTSATTIISSSSFWLKLLTVFSISSARSYTVTSSTPSGRPFCNSASLRFTAAMVLNAFSPCRMTIIPPTTSPSPFSSAIPRRAPGTVCTLPISASVNG